MAVCRRQGDTPAAFMTMISESELSLLRTWADANTSEIGAIIITSSGMSSPVMPTNTRTVCRWLVIKSNSRIAWVNHITIVRLTQVSTNAPMVVRNMYQPIDPIGLNFPTRRAPRPPRTPEGGCSAFPLRVEFPKLPSSCVHKMASPRQSR